MPPRHRLCLWLDDPDDPAGGNMLACDEQWAAAMDEAVALATEAAEGRLPPSHGLFLHAQFIKSLPLKNDPEFLSETAYHYYLQPRPLLDGPWNARDISDFILACAHRLYDQAHALDRWLASHFKSNPVGLPRTRSKFKNSRNYTPHGIRLYRACGKRAVRSNSTVTAGQ